MYLKYEKLIKKDCENKEKEFLKKDPEKYNDKRKLKQKMQSWIYVINDRYREIIKNKIKNYYNDIIMSYYKLNKEDLLFEKMYD